MINYSNKEVHTVAESTAKQLFKLQVLLSYRTDLTTTLKSNQIAEVAEILWDIQEATKDGND